MEGLILLFLHFGLGAIGVLASTLAFGIQILLFVVELIVSRAGKSIIPKPKVSERKKSGPLIPPVFWKVAFCLVAISGLVAIILNTFFFSPTANFLIDNALKHRDIEFSTDSLAGNFFTGELAMSSLKMKGSTWQIEVDECRVDFAPGSLLSRRKSFNDVSITGYRGTAIVEKEDEGSTRDGRKRRPDLKIKTLSITDASMDLRFADDTLPPIHSIKIDSFSSNDFLTRWPLFHLFFRSNLEGSLNDSPLLVEVSDVKPAGKRTKWQTSGIPIALFKGNGLIFDILEQGDAAIDVTDYWKKEDHLEIDMAWKLTLTGVSAKREETNAIRKAVAEYINESKQPLDIAFSLKMNPDELEGSSSEASTAIYRAVSTAAVKEVAAKRGIPTDSVDEVRQRLIRGVVDKVDQARKPK